MYQPLIIYDGICTLCNGAINFIIKNDKLKKFKFISLQSPQTHEIIKSANKIVDPQQSIILFSNNKIYTKSDAIINIAKQLGGIWSILTVLILIPKKWRDYLYTIVANHRYKWFGKYNSCPIPGKEIKARFLD